jgi:hypothetical protein
MDGSLPSAVRSVIGYPHGEEKIATADLCVLETPISLRISRPRPILCGLTMCVTGDGWKYRHWLLHIISTGLRRLPTVPGPY